MCQVLRCFGWGAEVLQRVLTFILGFITCCCICVGIILSIATGVAYGYNVSLAEWFDQRKSDVTVFVRRGQFVDEPQVRPVGRRMGDDNDLFASNHSVDYQDPKLVDDSKPLIDVMKQAQDSKNYADKLTKYSKLRAKYLKALGKSPDEIEEKLPDEEFMLATTENTLDAPPSPVYSVAPARRRMEPVEIQRSTPWVPVGDDKNSFPVPIEESGEKSRIFQQHMKKLTSYSSDDDVVKKPFRKKTEEEAAEVAADYYIDNQAI